MTLAKAGDGSVPDEAFNAVVDAIGQGPPEHTVQAADIDSQAAADGTVLTADGAGGASFEAGGGGSQPFSGVSVYKNANQAAIAVGGGGAGPGGSTAVTWQVESYDTDGYIAVPGDTFTAPADGIYSVVGTIGGYDEDGVNGQIYAYLSQNFDSLAPTYVRRAETRYDGTENEYGLVLSWTLELAAADTLTLFAKFAPDSAGSTWRISQGAQVSYLAITKLGALA